MENTPNSQFGKTSWEHSAPTKVKTSGSSSKSSSKSANRQPLCLRFRKADGLTPTVIAATDEALLTEFSTLNTGESPKDAVVVTLSSILLANVLPKFFLSVTACEGILRRTERRGKTLPAIFQRALEQTMARAEKNDT